MTTSWKPVLRQAAEDIRISSAKSTKKANTHAKHCTDLEDAFDTYLFREWEGNEGETYLIEASDSAEFWTCTCWGKDGRCETFTLTPDKASGKIWWGYGTAFYCKVSAEADGDVLSWRSPGARIASFVWWAKPGERHAGRVPLSKPSSAGKPQARPTRQPEGDGTGPCDEAGDTPHETRVGRRARRRAARAAEFLSIWDESGSDKALKTEDAPLAPTGAVRSQARDHPGQGPHTHAEAVAASRHLSTQVAEIRRRVEEPRGRPAADAQRQVFVDLCCDSEGSGEEGGGEEELAPPGRRARRRAAQARRAEAIGTDGAIFKLPTGFQPPPGLQVPPGLRLPSEKWDVPPESTAPTAPPPDGADGCTGTDGVPPESASSQASDANLHEPRRRSPKGQSDDETRAGSDSSPPDGTDCEEVPTDARPFGRAGEGPPGRRRRWGAARREARGPQARAQTHEIVVTLDKRSGDALGAELDTQDDGDQAALRITHIMNEGLFQLWNENNPQKLVETDDCIVEVNGQRGPAAKLVAQLKQFKVQEVVICRAGREAPSGGPSAAAAAAPAAIPRGPLDGRWFDSCGAVGTVAGSTMRWAHQADDGNGTTEVILTGSTVHMSFLGQMLSGILRDDQIIWSKSDVWWRQVLIYPGSQQAG